MTRKTRGHEPLCLASAVIAGCHKHPVRRQEPEQHPASRAVDAGADVDSIESASQRRICFIQRGRNVEDVADVIEDVGRARARPSHQLCVPLDSDVRRKIAAGRARGCGAERRKVACARADVKEAPAPVHKSTNASGA